jgi:hypothetical protein
MKHFKKFKIQLLLLVASFSLMSFTEADPSPKTKARFWGWSSMSCIPGDHSELHCKQCYYVFGIAIDCESCINYALDSSNKDCKDM